MNLLLSPHSDDETLFCTYTCLRHRPLVLVCFDGRRRKHYVPPEVREAETAAAMLILGCEHQHLHVPCDPPDWELLERKLADCQPDHVWAPLPEEDGHSQHNGVGQLALRLWPGRVSLYATYTMGGGKTTIGTEVVPDEGWPTLKRQALAAYVSQQARPGTRPHFERDQTEYLVEPGNQ